MKRNKKRTTNEFIIEAFEIHNGKFDYSLVEYKSNKDKVRIICPEHGEFSQEASSHLKGFGCSKCSGVKKLTTKEFITKATSIHNGFYNYSKVKYVNARKHVVIICPEHGEFKQIPANHLLGQNCMVCFLESQTKCVNKFISEANAIHNNKYDYSKVEYKTTKDKVIIICPKHGEFEQSPRGHLKGYECLLCGINKRRKTNEMFVKESKEMHGDLYDYSKAKYVDAHSKVVIICPIHGEFEQVASRHALGTGCNACSSIRVGKSFSDDTETFIRKARMKHGDLYNYSLSHYVNGFTNLTIICPKHGEFEQLPSNHKCGAGCPTCNNSSGEHAIREILLNSEIEFEPEYGFDDCININPLPFDFYLPELNTCIEYDGIQHFEPVDFFGGEEKFNEIKKRDKIKTDYCKDNNITLLRIRYDEDVSSKLLPVLSGE